MDKLGSFSQIQHSLDGLADECLKLCRSKRLPRSVEYIIGISVIAAGAAIAVAALAFPPAAPIAAPIVAAGAAIGILAYAVYQFYLDQKNKKKLIHVLEDIKGHNYTSAWSRLQLILKIDPAKEESKINDFQKFLPRNPDELKLGSIIFYTALLSGCGYMDMQNAMGKTESGESDQFDKLVKEILPHGQAMRGGGYGYKPIKEFLQNH